MLLRKQSRAFSSSQQSWAVQEKPVRGTSGLIWTTPHTSWLWWRRRGVAQPFCTRFILTCLFTFYLGTEMERKLKKKKKERKLLWGATRERSILLSFGAWMSRKECSSSVFYLDISVFYLRQCRCPASQNNPHLNVSMATAFIRLEEATVDYHYIHWGSDKHWDPSPQPFCGCELITTDYSINTYPLVY